MLSAQSCLWLCPPVAARNGDPHAPTTALFALTVVIEICAVVVPALAPPPPQGPCRGHACLRRRRPRWRGVRKLPPLLAPTLMICVPASEPPARGAPVNPNANAARAIGAGLGLFALLEIGTGASRCLCLI